MPQKLNTSQFIEKASFRHGNRYDYSQVAYIEAHSKVIIVCPLHGPFSQKPGMHLHGNGCHQCAGTRRNTTESFIKKAIEKHGELYSYEKVSYHNNHIKVEISCPVHGSFWMKPNSHTDSGQGCPVCGGKRPIDDIFTEFITRSKQKHGNRYDYSETVLVRAMEKVKIICPKHGPFYQQIYKHMRGDGCPHCSLRKKATTESFIVSAKQVHGNRYTYESVVYVRSGQKVTIHCQQHGNFSVNPNHHLRGVGCAKCDQLNPFRRSQFIDLCGKHKRKAHLYLIHVQMPEDSFFKIGITSRSVRERLRPEKLTYNILHMVSSDDAGSIWDLEKRLALELSQFSYPPSIKFGGHTECYQFPDVESTIKAIGSCFHKIASREKCSTQGQFLIAF